MLTKTRALITAALIASTAISAPANAAAVPVIDPSAIARIREVVTTASQQLAKAQEQLGQMREMNRTIGKAGQGQNGTILKSSGLDFDGDRKSVEEGKRVSVSVDLGGRLIYKKKKKLEITTQDMYKS